MKEVVKRNAIFVPFKKLAKIPLRYVEFIETCPKSMALTLDRNARSFMPLWTWEWPFKRAIEDTALDFYHLAGHGEIPKRTDLIVRFRDYFDKYSNGYEKSKIVLTHPVYSINDVYSLGAETVRWFFDNAMPDGTVPAKQCKYISYTFPKTGTMKWAVLLKARIAGLLTYPMLSKKDFRRVVVIPFYRYTANDMLNLPFVPSISAHYIASDNWYVKKYGGRKTFSTMLLLDLKNMRSAMFQRSTNYLDIAYQLSGMADMIWNSISYRVVGNHCYYCPFYTNCVRKECQDVIPETVLRKIEEKVKQKADQAKLTLSEAEEIRRTIGI